MSNFDLAIFGKGIACTAAARVSGKNWRTSAVIGFLDKRLWTDETHHPQYRFGARGHYAYAGYHHSVNGDRDNLNGFSPRQRLVGW